MNLKRSRFFRSIKKTAFSSIALLAMSQVGFAQADALFTGGQAKNSSVAASIGKSAESLYVPGELIVAVKEGVDIQQVLNQGPTVRAFAAAGMVNRSSVVVKPLIDTKPLLKKLRKKLQANSRAAFSVESSVSDEELLRDVYAKMSKHEKRLHRTHVLKLNGADLEKEIERLKSNRDVEFVEPNYVYTTSYTPSDPLYNEQWSHLNTQAEQAWDLTRGASDVVIAVIDSGVDHLHEDLKQNIWKDAQGNPGRDFVDINTAGYTSQGFELIDGEDYTVVDDDPMDYNGHGTHVAGIVAAPDNGVGVIGAAPGTKIMSLRAGFSMTKSGREYGLLDSVSIINAINYAADNGADIINMSFGSSQSSAATEAALNKAYDKGVVLIAAAGNTALSSLRYPAAYEKVIAVANTDRSDKRSPLSTHGRWVEVAAPGQSILSTYPTGRTDTTTPGYKALSGTSMASPYVAGVAGLVLSKNPQFTPDQVKAALLSGVDAPNSMTDRLIGTGRINALKAVQADPTQAVPLATITTPGFDNFIMDGLIPVSGSASDSFQLEVSEYPYSQQWTLLNSGGAMSNAFLGYITPGTPIERGKEYFIRLKVTSNGVSTSDIVKVKLFDTAPGWPQNTFAHNFGSPTAYDLDGDGTKEIVVATGTVRGGEDGHVFVFNHDGSLRWHQEMIGKMSGSPAIQDIDKDGVPEIVVSGWRGLQVFNADGTVQEGSWPRSFYTHRDPVLADLDNDGDLEIVIPGSGEGSWDSGVWREGLSKVQAFHHDGSVVTGWPLSIKNTTTVAVADPDKDGLLEVVFGTHGEDKSKFPTEVNQLHMVRHDGTPYSAAWPQTINGWMEAPPVIGDMDRDGIAEIVALTPGYVYAFNADGTKQSAGWPIAMEINYWSAHNPPVLADIDRDKDLEVIFTTGLMNGAKRPWIHSYHHDGTTVTGWPVSANQVPENRYNSISPLVGDIDSDGIVDIVIRTGEYISVFAPDGVQKFGLGQYQENGTGIIGSTPSPLLDDIDNDGKVELLFLSNSNTIGLYQYGSYDKSLMEWSKFQRDSANSGSHPVKDVGPIVGGTVTGELFGLNRINWDGTSVQQGGVTRVGGYPRDQFASAYDYETLMNFDTSKMQGTVVGARLRVHVAGGVLGPVETITLYNQNKKDWLPATVNYDYFCESLEVCPAWGQALGSAQVSVNPEWIEITGDALVQVVNGWLQNPASNRGLILGGSFYAWEHYVEIDSVELVVEVQ